jgi:hypothetical protein
MGERSAAQTRLVEAVTSNGPTFMEESALLPTVVHEPKGDSTPTNFGNLSAARFGSLLAEITETAAANPNDPAALHRLRILGKRLRYSLEIMAGCFPPTFRAVVYPAVEQLQEHLGGIQDAAVALERLAQLRDRTRKCRSRDWSRLAKGFEAHMKSVRAGMTVGRRAFHKWRREWAVLVRDLKVEIVAATVVAQ